MEPIMEDVLLRMLVTESKRCRWTPKHMKVVILDQEDGTVRVNELNELNANESVMLTMLIFANNC